MGAVGSAGAAHCIRALLGKLGSQTLSCFHFYFSRACTLQSVQSVRSADESFPSGHSSHATDLKTGAYMPGAHAVQADGHGGSALGAYLPGSQLSHATASGLGKNVPGSQARLGMGVGATVGRRVVVGATVGLGEGAGVGRKHWSAEPAPTAEQLPTGQSVQTAAPPREYLAQVRSMHVEV